MVAGGGKARPVSPAKTTGRPMTPTSDDAIQSSASAAVANSDDALSRIMAAVPLSDLERQLQGYYRRQLQQQLARLNAEIEEMAAAFDSALTMLRRDKFKLERDLKLCEMRQLVHAQELALLQDFDKKEVVLIQKRSARLEDRQVSLD